MSALSDISVPEIQELRLVRPELLEPLLQEETETWRRWLDWDFQPSADLVRRFVGMQALSGFALFVRGQMAGYAYYVWEDHKGLVGDLYVLESHRTVAAENLLLDSVLAELMRLSFVRRIESQLMMLGSPVSRPLPKRDFARLHLRNFMVIDSRLAAPLPPGRAAGADYVTWQDRYQEESARLIAGAYRGHVDSDINDQYRSIPGARRFLTNIIQYPGCGSFLQPASFLAFDATGRLAGISLASNVAPDVGHITQICVSADAKGQGFGYEMLRRSLQELARRGCRSVSLTVTASNERAVNLYLDVGFVTRRQFAAYVWDGF